MSLQIKSFEEYQAAYQRSIENPEAFWADIASTFHWYKKWDKVLEWEFKTPTIKWFQGGKTNITYNALDRHLETRGDKVAFLYEPNEPNEEVRKYTYRQLYCEVNRTANTLKSLGIRKGDRICFYMPMVPELAIGLLACARIGAIHTVVFAGFSASSLADRINDTSSRMVLCSDYNSRGAKNIPVKKVVDEAMEIGCPSVERVLVLKNTDGVVGWNEARDIWWHDAHAGQSDICEPEPMDAEDTLFILYTSGSTGKPKGVVHTTGGYMVFMMYTFLNVFQPKEEDVYWCTADIGWVTGHSYTVYGPLLAGATSLIFGGVPTYPKPNRFWDVCDKHKVNIFYTAPTAIRALMAAGDEWLEGCDLGSLRVLGSVGEPINAEAWHWYNEKIGKKRCPIVDTWWQTETGGILISPLAGITPTKPSFATLPLPGVQPCLMDHEGREITEFGLEGMLCFKFPWPGMLRTTYGDHERCRQTYFSTYKDLYFTGDGARRDGDGMYRIIGRVDDVINVSGHRIGTAEVEDAINRHDSVVESAVVGFPHDIKGQGIYAYVITDRPVEDKAAFRKALNDTVSKIIGPIAKPDVIQIVAGLPKTRSGKIMRRILRKIASGSTETLGDTSTLLDPGVVNDIQEGAQALKQ